jgi:hypothetical protein
MDHQAANKVPLNGHDKLNLEVRPSIKQTQKLSLQCSPTFLSSKRLLRFSNYALQSLSANAVNLLTICSSSRLQTDGPGEFQILVLSRVNLAFFQRSKILLSLTICYPNPLAERTLLARLHPILLVRSSRRLGETNKIFF